MSLTQILFIYSFVGALYAAYTFLSAGVTESFKNNLATVAIFEHRRRYLYAFLAVLILILVLGFVICWPLVGLTEIVWQVYKPTPIANTKCAHCGRPAIVEAHTYQVSAALQCFERSVRSCFENIEVSVPAYCSLVECQEKTSEAFLHSLEGLDFTKDELASILAYNLKVTGRGLRRPGPEGEP
jgi:hypothetical protein